VACQDVVICVVPTFSSQANAHLVNCSHWRRRWSLVSHLVNLRFRFYWCIKSSMSTPISDYSNRHTTSPTVVISQCSPTAAVIRFVKLCRVNLQYAKVKSKPTSHAVRVCVCPAQLSCQCSICHRSMPHQSIYVLSPHCLCPTHG